MYYWLHLDYCLHFHVHLQFGGFLIQLFCHLYLSFSPSIFKKKLSQFKRFYSKIRVNNLPQSRNFHYSNVRSQCMCVCTFFHVCVNMVYTYTCLKHIKHIKQLGLNAKIEIENIHWVPIHYQKSVQNQVSKPNQKKGGANVWFLT